MFNSQQKLPSIDTIANGGDGEAFTTTSTNGHIANGSLSNGTGLIPQEEQPLNHDSSASPSPIISSPSNDSVMSINRLCEPIEPIESAKERVAVEVLQNLSRGGTDNSTPIESSATSNSQMTGNGFAHRIQSSTFLRKTIDIYESGKKNSPLLKYGANAIESSIKTITRPIAEQLDEYACRGWDKLEEKFPRVMDTNTATTITSSKTSKNGEDMNLADTQDQESRRRRSDLSQGQPSSHRRPHRASNGSSNFAPYSYNNSVTASTSAPRSRWHAMLVGTGTVVGGVGAAVSEESMKSLKYCLHWLHYANQQIEHQIAVLRDFIVKLTGPSSNALIHTSASSTLGSIKRDVVDTLRKVIEVVSKYAGVCLPEHARQNVKEFILTLPIRWASINRTDHSATPSPMSSPQMTPANNYPHNQTADYARRLLSLATESLEMLKGVAIIFGETIEKAESWLGRLKAVGVTTGGTGSNIDLEFDPIPNGYNNVSRSRQLSGPKRPNGSIHRKQPRPVPREDDDISINGINGIDDFSSSESETEDKRMEMDQRHHSIKSTTARSNGLSQLSAKKRPKKAKKEEDEKMDLS